MPEPLQHPSVSSAKEKGHAFTPAVIGAVLIIAAIFFLNGRALENFLFGYPGIYNELLYRTTWPEEIVHAAALAIWSAYTVVFTALSYDKIARIFFRKPTWRIALFGFLAMASQAPLLVFFALIHDTPVQITNLSGDLQCSDIRTKGRVTVWYYKNTAGEIALFKNGYGGSWKGEELKPATQSICDAAQAHWKASGREEELKLGQKRDEENKAKIVEPVKRTESDNIAPVAINLNGVALNTADNRQAITVDLISLQQAKGIFGKSYVNSIVRVCNEGQEGLTSWASFSVHFWLVPDDKNQTLRWSYYIDDLPTKGCKRLSDSAVGELSRLSGTFYFSKNSSSHEKSFRMTDGKIDILALPEVLPSPPRAVDPNQAKTFSNEVSQMRRPPIACPSGYHSAGNLGCLKDRLSFLYGERLIIHLYEDLFASPAPLDYTLYVSSGVIELFRPNSSEYFRVQEGYEIAINDYDQIKCVSCPSEFVTYVKRD